MTAARRVVLGGVAIAAADVVLLTAFWWPRGVHLDRILRHIAAGLFGATTSDVFVAIGLVLHVAFAIAFVAIYELVARRAPALRRQWWLFGAPYGLVVWAGMTFAVTPLSRIGYQGVGKNVAWIALSLAFHAIVVGLGSAFVARSRA